MESTTRSEKRRIDDTDRPGMRTKATGIADRTAGLNVGERHSEPASRTMRASRLLAVGSGCDDETRPSASPTDRELAAASTPSGERLVEKARQFARTVADHSVDAGDR